MAILDVNIGHFWGFGEPKNSKNQEVMCCTSKREDMGAFPCNCYLPVTNS